MDIERLDTERREWRADLAVHTLGLGLGAAGAIVMLAVTNRTQLLPVAVYLFGLLAMLSCSAVYNAWPSSRYREALRRLDHAAIFVMIAGTYTPLTLRLPAAWATGLAAGVWAAALVGVAAKLWQPRKVETLSVVLYLALGWIGLVAAGPLLASLDRTTLVLLLLGGLVYSGGVVFHLSKNGRYSRALWHACVLVAAGVHYAAILTMLET